MEQCVTTLSLVCIGRRCVVLINYVSNRSGLQVLTGLLELSEMRMRLDAFVLHWQACMDPVIHTFAHCIHDILSMQTSFLTALPSHIPLADLPQDKGAHEEGPTSSSKITLLHIWASCGSLGSQLRLLCKLCHCRPDVGAAAQTIGIGPCSSIQCGSSKCRGEARENLHFLGFQPSDWERGTFPTNGQDLLDQLYQGGLCSLEPVKRVVLLFA